LKEIENDNLPLEAAGAQGVSIPGWQNKIRRWLLNLDDCLLSAGRQAKEQQSKQQKGGFYIEH